ncbi:MAG: hypothetical protein LBR47_07400 [Spirochaetaceae bacterium]|jgi:hypothetical protein|nr:hypothetical protein [Spirochaetaceae bacterium]
MELKRISKKKCRIARTRAFKLLSDIQKELKDHYTFQYQLVGSGKWGTMVEDKDGKYDLDYQLLLTKNSKVFKKNKFNDPGIIKKSFLNAFNKHKCTGEVFDDSTTAITLRNENEKPFSVDFVLLKINPEYNEIIRRNNKKETPSVNEYTWNKLDSDHGELYSFFKNLSSEQKRKIVDKVIENKNIHKNMNENDPDKRSSSELFRTEIAKYKNEYKS